ncbi:hypothetical protein N478_10725 [Pseudoalteromonas luteoviolacea S4060-1]|uniref:Uncharacterized protein n=1 Tax=Pseudoalteromonas luteoviolacea S4060-1 TaxID=1365257 RepID=A0A161Z166_9GAMM|nr:hypothetical protein N478_10725 [Pseudoalteromonas luteoviolacea S4060-1]
MWLKIKFDTELCLDNGIGGKAVAPNIELEIESPPEVRKFVDSDCRQSYTKNSTSQRTVTNDRKKPN